MEDLAPEGYLNCAGQRLEYRLAGAPDTAGLVILLLHEGLGCVGMWRDFPETLHAATGVPVLAYSRTGYGRSSPVTLPRPLTYMHDEALLVVPELLRAAGIGRAILFGHSDGASIAAIHAGAGKADCICGLVLMAPHFFVEDISIESIAAARNAYEKADLRARLAKYHGDNVDTAFFGWNGAWLDPGFRDWDITEHLPGISVPVLLLQGRNDEYGTLEQVACAERLIGSGLEVLVLDDCGHSPHRDRRDETTAAVAGFVGRIAKS